MLQLAKALEGHELVVGLGRPRVDLDGVLERDHQELDPLVLHDAEVHRALQLAHVDPAVAPLHLLQGGNYNDLKYIKWAVWRTSENSASIADFTALAYILAASGEKQRVQ